MYPKGILYAVFVFLFAAIQAVAQKPLISDYAKVLAAAKSELDQMMVPGSVLQQAALKNAVRGKFTADIGIHEKGKVLSVFMVSGSEDIGMQNRAKDLIRSISFSFKMPAGKNYKIQYAFDFK
jgi:TonB family protein